MRLAKNAIGRRKAQTTIITTTTHSVSSAGHSLIRVQKATTSDSLSVELRHDDHSCVSLTLQLEEHITDNDLQAKVSLSVIVELPLFNRQNPDCTIVGPVRSAYNVSEFLHKRESEEGA